MPELLNSKHLVLDWHRHRPDGRHYRFRHNKRASSLYLQVFALEIVWWYR